MTETQERPSRLAMEIAVHMEVHAALSTTTEAKAREIDSLLAADRLVIRQSDTRIEGGGEPAKEGVGWGDLLAGYQRICAEHGIEPTSTDVLNALKRHDAKEPVEAPRAFCYTATLNLGPRPTIASYFQEGIYTVPLYLAPPITISPTPEHVEGDVLSVGEMEALARRLRDYRPPALDPAHGREHHPICDEAADALTSATTRIQRAEREIARCHERLEIDHVFVMGATAEDDLVRQDISMSERHEMPDAVECRDATISLLEQDLKEVTAQLADAVKVLERLKGVVTYPCDTSIQARGYGTRSIDISGCEYIAKTVDTFLSTIGEKPDAE